MRSIKLYATGSSTANNVANITIPSASRILGIQFAIEMNSILDDARAIIELSQASATEIAVNAAQQCIAEFRLWQNFVTSGLNQTGSNGFVPVDVPVKQGQIIYLHATTANSVYFFTGLIWLRD